MVDQIASRSDRSFYIRHEASKLLKQRISQWCNPDDLATRICIYTTGSFGRGDASSFSDLDVFIVSLEENVTGRRLLSGLEEIELLASIVHTNRELRLPNLDGDGNYLRVHSLSDYLVGLGKPDDDANNTFTGRLLLLLESKAIFGSSAYELVRQECIERYWVDYADHSGSFLPAFLTNDILRFWRTLCVNYEAGEARDPAKRRAKNLKLKFSRLLTCFSAVLSLQAEFGNSDTVTADRALAILGRTPMQRLEDIQASQSGRVDLLVRELQEMYSWFLQETDCSKDSLYEKMSDPGYYKDSLLKAREFGDKMFELINAMSSISGTEGSRFLRYLTV
ncbi:nucleotidyltransferase domain-containing protein [Paracoccus aeridis]|uniref:nucleotidyltransferase domain-containing protein n=1 Tax=Paracoccus aeridis TaxID=1966466 RepID=UPI0010AB1572|nr:nucleotidyltransferase domain-containing protein [Paracoccus aeridis]